MSTSLKIFRIFVSVFFVINFLHFFKFFSVFSTIYTDEDFHSGVLAFFLIIFIHFFEHTFKSRIGRLSQFLIITSSRSLNLSQNKLASGKHVSNFTIFKSNFGVFVSVVLFHS